MHHRRGTHEKLYSVRRLTVPVPGVEEFQRRYEAAVPALPLSRLSSLVAQGAPWAQLWELLTTSPHGFVIYFRNDLRPLMAAAGDPQDCVAYLMGNDFLTDRMFHHDPRVMLYAPLHTVIWEDAGGDAWFTMDQPSSRFESFETPDISEVGVELDRKLAALLRYLRVDVPDMLSLT